MWWIFDCFRLFGGGVVVRIRIVDLMWWWWRGGGWWGGVVFGVVVVENGGGGFCFVLGFVGVFWIFVMVGEEFVSLIGCGVDVFFDVWLRLDRRVV